MIKERIYMANCSECGSWIPDGQKICSMCYGDIDYGRDGYYRQWAENEMQRQQEQEYYEIEQYENQDD
jgi:predicted amidophosphoribosyltransferase